MFNFFALKTLNRLKSLTGKTRIGSVIFKKINKPIIVNYNKI